MLVEAQDKVSCNRAFTKKMKESLASISILN